MKKVLLDDETNDFAQLARSKLQPQFLPRHERKWQIFSYNEPELAPTKKRAIARLCTTDLSCAMIQKLDEGGESRLHSHASQDGFFIVLRGQATFTAGNGEDYQAGPLEGVVVPRGTLYSFRKTGDETLLLLQVETFDPTARHNAYGNAPDEQARTTPISERIDFYDAKIEA